MTTTDLSTASLPYLPEDVNGDDFAAAFAAAPAGGPDLIANADEEDVFCRSQLDYIKDLSFRMNLSMGLAESAKADGDKTALRNALLSVRTLAALASDACQAFEAICSGPYSDLTDEERREAIRLCNDVYQTERMADRMLFQLEQEGPRGVNLEPMVGLLSNIGDGLKQVGTALGMGALWFLQQVFRRPGAV
ncbi:hypothetical protein [Futiania mangrovi]|uniref:Uncharacterized protein n=1 Tax=Futiania mangrovi TaxID=2959716 RepID=A0A9J6PLN7_9PROT|nr:hypothetical protein [Futiania mangrovii]MCP1337559.1 hypothetical protein [Futiania mangrovii]